MSKSLTEIEEMARALSDEERAQLAEALLQSLETTPAVEIQSAWEVEITARLAAHDRGELEVFSAESVFAEARRLAR